MTGRLTHTERKPRTMAGRLTHTEEAQNNDGKTNTQRESPGQDREESQDRGGKTNTHSGSPGQ